MKQHFVRHSPARGRVPRDKPAVALSAGGRPAMLLARVRWEERLAELREFKVRHGHSNVPRGWTPNPSLSYWVINQRYKLRKGTLSEDQVRKLRESGISWSSASERSESRAQAWTRMFHKIAEFKKTHGHTDVAGARRSDRKLANWIANQRFLLRSGKLPDDRRRRLESLGILWNLNRGRSKSRDEAWERMYAEAVKLKARYGSCDAAGEDPRRVRLARWIAYQRQRLRQNTLPDDRRHRIRDLGIGGNPPPPGERSWQRMYSALSEYRRAHGHCRIGRSSREVPRLGRWLYHQRSLERARKLDARRREALDRIGVEWLGAPRRLLRSGDRWDQMFGQLLAYKARHGHARVPRRGTGLQALADWVARQRHWRKIGRLRPDRIERLTEAGFDWAGGRGGGG